MKFTLREIFLLILVVALGLGWWLDNRQKAAQVESLTAYHRALKEIAFVADQERPVDKADQLQLRLVLVVDLSLKVRFMLRYS